MVTRACAKLADVDHLQYEKFWANPYEMSIMWISQLFSMLTISEMIQGNVNMNKEKSPQLVEEKSAIANRYATASAQCLVLADYTKPQRYLVEALFLYCQVKGMTSVDPAGEVSDMSVVVCFHIDEYLDLAVIRHHDTTSYSTWIP